MSSGENSAKPKVENLKVHTKSPDLQSIKDARCDPLPKEMSGAFKHQLSVFGMQLYVKIY
jgi:hypothetical protein